MARKSPMADDVVPFGKDQLIFIAERVGKAANKIEQPIAARRNMGTVLDITVRPEALRSDIVAPVEQRIEGFEHERLVPFRGTGGHIASMRKELRPSHAVNYLRRSGICRLVGRFCSVSKPRPSILRAPQNKRSPWR